MSGAGFKAEPDAREARLPGPARRLGEANALPWKPDIAAAAGRCNKPIARWPLIRRPRRIPSCKNNKISGREPDELFATRATQGVGGLGSFGRHRRAVGRTRASGRIHLQI